MAKPSSAEQFRRNVAALCAALGGIQRVATEAGISRVYLSRIIHGHAQPTIGVAGRIADAVGLPLGDLFRPLGKRRGFQKIFPLPLDTL
ncbi:MAG: helix-turn-helix domain-containing protein [Candidatus Dormibacteria bacterium]